MMGLGGFLLRTEGLNPPLARGGLRGLRGLRVGLLM